jgi:hypothetical protein
MPIKTNLQSMVPAKDKFKKEIVLLSHGYSMPTLIPNGRITVYPWDQTIDDWVLKNLKRFNINLLPFEIVKRLVNLKSIDDMPLGDTTTVLLVAKALARDSKVTYTAECTNSLCQHKERIEIVVPDQLERISEKKDDYPGHDDIVLPACKDVVSIKPLLVKDQVSIINLSEGDATPRRLYRASRAIKAVNSGEPDSPDEITTYLAALQPSDFDYLTDKMQELEPHLGTELKHKCDKCGTEYTHNLSLDAEFFR